MNNSLPYSHVNLTRWVSSIITPIILFGCAIGNIVSFFVLLRPRLRKETTSIYLAVLCFAEMGTCYTGLLRQFLLDAFDLDIRKINSFTCRIHIYLTYLFLRLVPIILVLVTLQRYLYVSQLALCSLKQTLIQLFCCILFVCLAEFHFFLFYDLTYSTTLTRHDYILLQCTVDSNYHKIYYKFRSQIYPKLTLVLYTIIPLGIIIIGNVLLIRTVRQSSKRSRSKTKKKRSVTRMLYAVCILYTVLTSPASIFLAIAPASYELKPTFRLQWTLLRLLFYLCHSVNFILFCATGSTFRQELIVFLKTICFCRLNCRCRKIKHNNITLNNRIQHDLIQNKNKNLM
ncbi:unnamed protein product [Rotaria sordida]|uniref:G-protein coupled receptors family 1 profile domain-containing protein n=1 Tax=Rotaria sordida TaxID=392033 RepID=A0A819NWW0_9BILA|nr:unnamed protein product [Rotaria sordida]CAF3913994.1 unnamed protein product [Rotaria sordida]CAF4003335.1 unnamed protein product [Rotaria sordida]